MEDSKITKGQNVPDMYLTNLSNLVKALSILESLWLAQGGHEFVITSGFRTQEHNAQVGGRPRSAHMTCEAVDISDESKALRNWIMANQAVLPQAGLFMARPETYPHHIHVQTRPASKRIFVA